MIFLLFFFSGYASLIYEVIWARKLGLVFGITSYAVSTVLAVFMAGLALGSFLFGKIVDKFLEPRKFLFLVGLLGVGEGSYALFTPLIFRLIEKLQLILVGNLILSPLNLNLLRFCLSFLALILPTTLCGGTLPVLSKFLIRFKEEVGEKIALLYSLNTFGGVAGVISAGFFLIIPLGLGVNGTIYTAGVIDILAGLIFILLSLKSKFLASLPSLKKEDFESRLETKPKTKNLLLFTFFFTGFLALALEVLWTRVLVLTLSSSTYAFSLILAGFLTGIALGSILVAKFVDKIKNLWFWLALVILVIGLFIIFLTPFFDDLPFYFIKIFQNYEESFWKLEAAVFILIFLILLFPTILMGASFPLGSKIYLRDIEKTGGAVGEIYSANTLGCVFGPLMAGFLLIPLFGLEKSILILAMGYFFLAGILIWFSSLKIKLKIIFVLAVIGLGLSSFFLPSWNKTILTSGPTIYASQYSLNPEILKEKSKEEKIIFYKDGLLNNVVVNQFPDGYLELKIDGKVDASAGSIELKEIGDLDTELLSGYLPLFLYPQNSSDALVIGLGSGITLGAIGQSSLKKIDLVEIEPAVLTASGFFADFNHQILTDPRVNVVIEDARNWLLTTGRKYDIITAEPSNLYLKGMVNLFTREYFESLKNHLKPGGLALQWIHLYGLDKESLKIVLNTFSQVFPYSNVWSSTSFKDLFLVGSNRPIKIDFELAERLKKQSENIEIKNDLQKIAISDPLELLPYFIFSQKGLRDFVGEAKLLTDNYPILEFRAPLNLYQETISQNLEELYLSREELDKDLVEKIPQLKKYIDFQAASLQAAIFSQKADLDKAIEVYERALVIMSNPILEGKLARLYFQKGMMAEERGQLKTATSFYEKSAELNPKNPETLNNLGSIYFNQGDVKMGEYYFKKTIEVAPWFSLGWSNLGILYLSQGRETEAKRYFEEALKIDPQNIDALNYLKP